MIFKTLPMHICNQDLLSCIGYDYHLLLSGVSVYGSMSTSRRGGGGCQNRLIIDVIFVFR